MLVIGAPSSISLPSGPNRLYRCPPDLNLNVFISIAQDLICLWSSKPVHLLSYVSRPSPFCQDTGGYHKLNDWCGKDGRDIFVQLGNATIDHYRLTPCPPQLPIGTSAETSWFLVFVENKPKEKETNYLDSLKAHDTESEDGDLHLTHYFHDHFGRWLSFNPPVKVSGNQSSLAFSSRSQLLAVAENNAVEIYSLKVEKEILSWSVELSSELYQLSWSHDGNFLIALTDGKLTCYSSVGELIWDKEVRGSSLAVFEDTLVVAGQDSLEILKTCTNFPYISTSVKSLDFNNPSENSLLLFREHCSSESSKNNKWTYQPIRSKFKVVNSCEKFVAVVGPNLFGLYNRADSKWNYSKTYDFFVSDFTLLPNGMLCILGYSMRNNEHEYCIRIVEADGDISRPLEKIALEGPCVYFSASSFSNHLIVMYENMKVHIYRIKKEGKKINVEFSLNLSLGGFNSSEDSIFGLTKWKIEICSKKTLSSPSEVDLHSEPAEVSIDNLLFLQGDCLFSVVLRPSSPVENVSATSIEGSGVESFYLLTMSSDLWLITIHEGCAKLRRWPFNSKVDIIVPLSFYPHGFYPSLHDGALIGVESNQLLHISDTKLIAPVIARFYIEHDEVERAQQIFESSEDKSILMEYVLFEILNQSNKLKAARILKNLSKSYSRLLRKTDLFTSLSKIARKVDVSEARWMFENSVGAHDIYSYFLEEGNVDSALIILMLRLVLSGKDETDQKVPILRLLELVLSTEKYNLIPDIRHIANSVWEKSTDLELIDNSVRLHAKNLVRSHRWKSFIEISFYWNKDDTSNLFEECFGKITDTAFIKLVDELPLDQRICSIWAQLDISPPTLESTRAVSLLSSQMKSSMVFRSDASIGANLASSTLSSQPCQISMSSCDVTQMTVARDISQAEQVVNFLSSVDIMRKQALIWRISVFADIEAIKELFVLDKEMFADLKAYFAFHSCTSWLSLIFDKV